MRLNRESLFLLSLVALSVAISCVTTPAVEEEPPAGFVPLFNGTNFEGWEGNLEFFRIEDGTIVAGRLDQQIPRNEFLCTKRDYNDFELRLQAKVSREDANGGIQIRSRRVPDHNEVRGYQADIGRQQTLNIWGALYDEYRRREMLAVAPQEELKKVYKPGEWNDYLIRCEGPRIRMWINGYRTIDYTEPDPDIELEGIIGLQVHSGDAAEIRYRNIEIMELGGVAVKKQETMRNPDQAVADLEMYPGLAATLFASEPMLVNPTNLDVDHRGRVWVTEVANYRGHGENDARPEGDRILILEDNNGDGVADTSKVYYQGRDVDAALGIAVLGNRVIVTAAPNVLVFTDEDGDDKPDRKEYLFTKSGSPQGDHSTHSFLFGPDGKLYWNMGNSGFYVHDKEGNLVVDQAGNGVLARDAARRAPEFSHRAKTSPYQGGMVFRCNLDGSDFEVLGHNFRNNYEVTVDSFGTLWQSDNDDDGNNGVRLNYVMEFGNFGYKDERTGAGWAAARTGRHQEIPLRHWHQNDPGVVPNFVQTGAGSPTGITVYEGRLLPKRLWDQVIHVDAGPGVVWAALAEKNGAGYKGKMVNILKADRDRWVRPVDVSVAPDGSLFVTDWYDPVVGWNRQYDTGRGRIFRIAPTGHPYGLPTFDLETARGAAAALKNPNYAVRFLAWTTLNTMQEGAEQALLRLFASENPRHRARALWLLTRIPGRGQKYVNQAIRDSDEDIRIVGLRAARQIKMDLIPVIRQLATDPSAQVRRECAIALRYSKSSQAPALWAELASRHNGNDRWYVEALGIGAERRWNDYLGAWLRKVGDRWQTPAGRDIIWRSRATVTPEYLAKIISRPDVDMEGSKRYLRAFDFQNDTPEKAGSLRQVAFEATETDPKKLALVASEALLRMKDFEIESESSLPAKVDRILELAAGSEQFARVVQRYELRRHYPGLMEVAVNNRDNPAGIAAVRTLLAGGEEGVIRSYLTGSNVSTAVHAVDVLGNSRDERGHPLLSDALRNENLDWPVREQAVRALANTGNGINLLVQLAKSGRFPEELVEVAGTTLTRTMSVRNREEAERYFPAPGLKNNEPVPQMTELLVYVGNAERGKEVWQAADCTKCHVVNGVGTSFGPDLSQIGNKLPKSGLYESILDPSGGVSPTYQLHHLTQRDGQEVSGFIVSETNTMVTLRLEGGVTSEYHTEDIVTRRASSLSAMPSDLQRRMSVDQLVDLVEYLTTLR